MVSFSSQHRTWIQTCAGRGCIPLAEAQQMFEAIWTGGAAAADQRSHRKPTEADMLAAIETCNDRLKPLSQQISVVRCDVRRQQFVVFVDSSAAAIMKTQTNFTESELSFFHLLLKELATATEDSSDPPSHVSTYSIDQMAAINLTNQIKPHSGRNTVANPTLTKQHAERLLARWTALGYFAVGLPAGRLYFGPRTVAEFGQFLRDAYPEHVHACPLCQATVFRAIRCDSCAKPYHKECLQKFLARSSKCPTCKRMWNVRLSQ